MRRAIEDPEFAAVFAEGERITERWPTVVKGADVLAGVDEHEHQLSRGGSPEV